jgi:hypothetical protein
MDTNNQFYDLLKTDRDRTLALLFLNSLSENLYKTDRSLDNFLKRNESDPFAKKVLSEFPPNWINLPDKSTIEEKISELKKRIEILPTIGLTIAVHPNEELLKNLENWAAANFAEKVIFDIRVNPEIVGGAIVVRNGSYSDFSISKRIEEVFSTHRDEILARLS